MTYLEVVSMSRPKYSRNFKLFDILQGLPIILILPIAIFPLVFQFSRSLFVKKILDSGFFQLLIYATIFSLIVVIIWEIILFVMRQMPNRDLIPMLALHFVVAGFLWFALQGGYAAFLEKFQRFIERLLI